MKINCAQQRAIVFWGGNEILAKMARLQPAKNLIQVLCLCLFGLWSCAKEKTSLGEFAFLNDFEGQFGYNPHVVVGKTSYSGKAFCKMNNSLEFSPAFIQQFKNISPKSFRKVKFSAFVLIPDPGTAAALVIQVWSPANTPLKVDQVNVMGKGLGVNRWKQLSLELPLEGLLAPENQLRCFIHNPGLQQVYVDDCLVEFLP